MKFLLDRKGFSFVEMVMATAISVIAMVILWQGVRFLQSMLSQQMRLNRVSQALILTQEITKNVREAHRVLSVGPDHLDLEVYNHGAYGFLDPQLYEKLKRIRYQFNLSGETKSIVREVYLSTEATKPDQSVTFLKDAELVPPTSSQPFFFASYLVGGSTVGVRVEVAMHPPYSKETWIPIKDEVYVQAD